MSIAFIPNSEFRIFSRGIVPPYRTTTGPNSEFLKPQTSEPCKVISKLTKSYSTGKDI
jgi:hypothetical protein